MIFVSQSNNIHALFGIDFYTHSFNLVQLNNILLLYGTI